MIEEILEFIETHGEDGLLLLLEESEIPYMNFETMIKMDKR